MTDLKTKMQDDRDQAVKSGDKFTRDTLRLVLGYIQTAEKSGKSSQEFTDAEVEAFLAKQVKTCRETAAIFAEAGKVESSALENAQADLLAAYLPRPLEDGEVMGMIQEALDSQENPNLGSVMKELKPRVGNRFDGKRLSELVRSQLA